MPAPASYSRRQFPGAAADTTISGAINNSVTTVDIDSTSGWPTGAYTGGILCELYSVTTGDTAEKVWAEDLTGSTLTITRAADGTSATSHSAGTGIRPIAGAIDADEANYAVSETVGKVTTAGDLLVADGANSLARLAEGSEGQVLQVASSAVAWGALPADSVDSSQIVDGSVDLAHMSANSVDSDQYVDGSIDTAHLADNAVTNAKIADNAVDSAEIAAGAIDLAHMSVNSVDSDQYVDGSIDGVHIANDAIDSQHYADGSIDTAHIAASQITNALMADDAIDSAEIADGAVDPVHHASFAENTVYEGPSGGGTPVATQRGRSWASKMETDSGNVDTTPTVINGLTITGVSLVSGRRYKLTFSGQLATTTGSGFAYVQFRKGGTLLSKTMTPGLSSVTTVTHTMTTYIEPATDSDDYQIYLESVSGSYNVNIQAAATQEAVFIIEDIGLATNS